MKGITPVVAIVILLTITISVTGLSYVLFQQTTEIAGESNEEVLEQQINKLTSCIKIENFYDKRVSLRNCGETNLSDYSVYVDNVRVPIEAEQTAQPGSTGFIDIDTAWLNLSSGSHEIKITTSLASDSETFFIANNPRVVLERPDQNAFFSGSSANVNFSCHVENGQGTTTIIQLVLNNLENPACIDNDLDLDCAIPVTVIGEYNWTCKATIDTQVFYGEERRFTLFQNSTYIPDALLTVGEQRTVVLIGEWDNLPFHTTAENISGMIFSNGVSLNTFYAENSYNRTWFTGEVYGPYNLGADPPEGCDVAQQLISAADNDVDFTQYRRVIFVRRNYTGCWAGIGGIPINRSTPDGYVVQSWTYLPYTSDMSFLGVSMHEMGHSFGALHSNFAVCAQPFNTSIDGCTEQNYGNYFAVMGTALYPPLHFTATHKNVFGFFNENETINTTGGTYLLKPLESIGGIKRIVIPYGLVSNFMNHTYTYNVSYSLEYRQPIGYDANYSGSGNFFSVFLTAEGRYYSSVIDILVDTHPETTTQYDAAMLSGQSYYDQNIRIMITLVSMDQNGAIINIQSV